MYRLITTLWTEKTYQNVLSYLLQNPTDSEKIGYILSWVNLSYRWHAGVQQLPPWRYASTLSWHLLLYCAPAVMDAVKSTAQRQQNWIYAVRPLRRRYSLPAEQVTLPTVGKVHSLGVYLDSELSMRAHITQLVSSCFGTLRQLRSTCIRRSLPSSPHLRHLWHPWSWM